MYRIIHQIGILLHYNTYNESDALNDCSENTSLLVTHFLPRYLELLTP